MEMVEWIMGCIQSTTFAVLTNGSPSGFFRPTRGIRQGCPLSPFIFLLVADALSRLILKARREGRITGLKVSRTEEVTHTLFVDDVLLFGIGEEENLKEYAVLIEKYKKAIGMMINIEKSMLAHNEFSEDLAQKRKEILAYPTKLISEGFKYLGFYLKPNSYAFQDWMWLYQKIEARVLAWEN